ncbi:MAG: MarR family winged helix-turn-helix transcriptional regulator [Geminicoccaceae bacterium]
MVTAAYDRALEPAGLKITQFSLLRAIERRTAPSITDLAEATGLERSTLGRNLRILESKGLIMLGVGDDERTRVVALTSAGESAIARALPHWEAAQRQLEDRLVSQELLILDRLVDVLRTSTQ